MKTTTKKLGVGFGGSRGFTVIQVPYVLLVTLSFHRSFNPLDVGE